MNKLRLYVLFPGLLLLLAPSLFGDHVPGAREGEIDYQLRVYLSRDFGELEPAAELKARIEEGEYRFTSATAGAYYRLHPNLKVGAFYRLQLGARHDDDWIDTNPGWEWQETRDRPEQLLIADVSPRFMLDFLPGENWVLLLKNRYIFNTYNGHQTLLLRPGLTWFGMRDREPVYSAGLAYGLYLPLNFSESTVYEHEPYLNLIYHLNETAKLELFGAWRRRIWTTSKDVEAAGQSGYDVTDSIFLIGTGVILRL